MATKLNAGEYTTGQLFRIDPDEINLDRSLNGRWQEHSEDDIDALAADIAQRGQLEPVSIRKVADNEVQIVFGYRRYLAVRKLNKGKKGDDRLKLACVLVDCNPEEAFLANIKENKERKATSPIDDAMNQRRLREQYGWSDLKIAEFYNISPSMVTVLKKLLLLSEDKKLLVHNRALSIQVATALTDLTDAEQNEVLKPEEPEEANGTGGEETTGGSEEGGGTATVTKPKAKKKKGKQAKKTVKGVPSSGTVLKRIRKLKGNKGEANGKPGGKIGRTMKEAKQFFAGLTGPGERKMVRETAEWLLKFFDGTYANDDTAEKKFKELYA